MNYLYENLGDERFQEFCSVLISKEFPNIQAFPVGQPDGGRDTLVYIMDSVKKKFIVYQVKFVRNAETVSDVHKWLTQTIEGEIEKIEKLIPEGAERYYLLTNVKGTAHLDSGSKDKVNEILEEHIKIPAICWWRDDISRLFEKDPIFKWSFPEIINGQDILNSALFNNLNENKERRESVLKAYLADQYKQDNDVKFRQIDLQSRLLDLFTDVPIRIKKFNEKNKALRQIMSSMAVHSLRYLERDEILTIEEKPTRAAAFLLDPKIQSNIQRILLEGGPGQGKSTISQYVCQVHRSRLLEKAHDITSLPEKIKNSPVRIPIKIDLRHIAAWVENKNPYVGVLNDEYFEKIWNKSLESFLIGHIFYHSKLEEFNSTDFIAICKLSPILFVFDGFDEIANLEVRKEVIDFINKGLHRISENAKSIQVIITSRPSVFSESLGFSIDTYPHFELTNITPEITKEYVEKWIKANQLDVKDGNEIKRLVDEKLGLPHLKELAKSPMQLAIFISLLRTKGESLPNKRTALYDSYIDLLFDRESEKSFLIRENRDLIIDIHQYLAWILHSEAELYKNSGSIGIDDLIRRLTSYLLQEGHKTDIAKIFDVVKDRVCALASRVQGTFEFEVQPLREYFCAKYLYKTSPYSPVGNEKPGTLPDRFEAISRNLYWQNVVRFFAGCFSKGELSMLIQKLKELQNDDILKYTNFPRILTAQLLSDYVFTQYPVLLKDVVSIIIDGIHIGSIINQDERSNAEPIALPPTCGQIEIVEESFSQLKKFPKGHYSNELIALIKNNPYNTLEFWTEEVKNIKGAELTKWLNYAYLLQILHKIERSRLLEIVEDEDVAHITDRIQILVRGNRTDIIYEVPKLKRLLYEGVLEGKIVYYPKAYNKNSLEFLAMTLANYNWSSLFNTYYMPRTLLDFVMENYRRRKTDDALILISDLLVTDEIDQKISHFQSGIKDCLKVEIVLLSSQLAVWDQIVESGRKSFGDCRVLYFLANIAAAIKSKDEKYEDFDDLNDKELSLCKRVRCARIKSGNIKYWENSLENAIDIGFVLLIFFTWSTPKTILKLLPKLTSILNSMDTESIIKLVNGLYRSITSSRFTKMQQKTIRDYFKSFQQLDILTYLLSIRFEYNDRSSFIYENIQNTSSIMHVAKDLKLDYLISKYFSDINNKAILDEIKSIYIGSDYRSDRYSHMKNQNTSQIKIPLSIAKYIMSDSKSYPEVIVFLAEMACRISASKNIRPVGEIAKKENWFQFTE